MRLTIALLGLELDITLGPATAAAADEPDVPTIGGETGTTWLDTGTAGVLRDSGWVNLPAGAKVANVTLAAVVAVAFGTTAPTISSLTVYVK